MIMNVYAKLTSEREQEDVTSVNAFMNDRFKKE